MEMKKSEDMAMDCNSTLLADLRSNPKCVKNFDDIVQLVHQIASKQNVRSMLRACMDQVQMNMRDIQSLRDILNRLRSVARINGLRFTSVLDKASVGTETSCQILGDTFAMEIVLDGRDSHFCRPIVLDVKVHQSEHTKSCPNLVEIIRNGCFIELSKHLKQLTEMYPVSADRQTTNRIFMALQSLETDVLRMNQLYKDSHKEADTLQIVMHGSVGFSFPRTAGQCFCLIYYLTPYDRMDSVSMKLLDQISENKGHQAELRITTTSKLYNLPISPLISNNHPVDGTGQPRFADVNQNNSVPLLASFVLKLKPPVVILSTIAEEIEAKTNIPVFGENCKKQLYMSLMVEKDEDTEVTLGKYLFRYHFDFYNWKAGLVEEIQFAHPAHLLYILQLLRKQAYLNTLVQSCIRTKRESNGDTMNVYYDVSLQNDMNLHVTFVHPNSINSTACAKISISSDGFKSCCLYVGKGDPSLCSDHHATTVLNKSFSLPITMRNVMHQAMQNCYKDLDKHTTRHTSIRLHSANKNQPTRIYQPITKPVTVIPSPKLCTSPAPMIPHATNINIKAEITSQNSEAGKKEMKHPMLANLLKPQENLVSLKPTNAVQPKEHPMLMTLLKERDPNTAPSSMRQQLYQQNSVMLQQQYHQENISQNSLYMSQPMPPPSYPSMKSEAPNMPSSYQMPQQLPYASHPSPLNVDELPTSLSSTLISYNPAASMPHSMTPPLMPAQGMVVSPQNQSLSSPMCASLHSPIHPLNTPQSVQLASPTNSAMTSPMVSPTPRRIVAGRRPSRQKSISTEAMTTASANEMNRDFTDPGFMPQFDTSGNDVEGHQMANALNVQHPVMSPAYGLNFMQHQHVSPATSDIASAFDFNMDATSNMRNSFNKGLSTQSFSGHPSVTGTFSNSSQDGSFSMPLSENINTNDGLQQNILQMKEMTKSDNLKVNKVAILCDQPETDPFTFDDNRIPSKISMPENSGTVVLQQKGNKAVSRHSSVSSIQSNEETTLKGLLSSSNSSVGSKFSGSKSDKNETLQSMLGRAPLSIPNQRKGAQDNVLSGTIAGGGQNAAHKALVRQNAIGRNGQPIKSQSTNIQSRVGDGKDKIKKRALTKDDGTKPTQKRRGRPPSTDKKEHPGKRKKLESTIDDGESRGKIVLNVQLNKGTPISSTTKTKPVPPDNSVSSEKNSNVFGSATNMQDIPKHDEHPAGIQQYLKNQIEMGKKKKEGKLLPATSSPVTNIGSKTNTKPPNQSSSLGSAAATPPNPVGSNKVFSSSGSNKSSGLSSLKANSGQQQKAAAGRSRKGSINEVVDKLHAGVTSNASKSLGIVGASAAVRSAFTGSNSTKPLDKQSNSDANSNTSRKRNVQSLGNHKPGQVLNSPLKLGGGKSVGDDLNISKTTNLNTKQNTYNRSPSHVSKPPSGMSRASTVIRKENKVNSLYREEIAKYQPVSIASDSNEVKTQKISPALPRRIPSNIIQDVAVSLSPIKTSPCTEYGGNKGLPVSPDQLVIDDDVTSKKTPSEFTPAVSLSYNSITAAQSNSTISTTATLSSVDVEVRQPTSIDGPSSAFNLSPRIESPFAIDDDLMDEAVS